MPVSNLGFDLTSRLAFLHCHLDRITARGLKRATWVLGNPCSPRLRLLPPSPEQEGLLTQEARDCLQTHTSCVQRCRGLAGGVSLRPCSPRTLLFPVSPEQQNRPEYQCFPPCASG